MDFLNPSPLALQRFGIVPNLPHAWGQLLQSNAEKRRPV
jgi:hypothetical protein